MSIRRKLLLGVTAATLVTILCGFAAVRFLGEEGLRRIDQERASYDLARAAGALDNELAHMETALRFKSASDITYRFAQDRDKQMAANYFSLEALRGGNLNLMALFDTKGTLAAGAAFDLATRESIPLEPLFAGLPGFIRHPAADGGPLQGRGLVRTPAGPMLVCWQPVFNSLGWGPPRGTLVAGRLLDGRLVNALARQVRVQFTARPLEEMPPDLAGAAREAQRRGEGVFYGKADGGNLPAYGVYPDVSGAPALLLTVIHPSSGMEQLSQAMLLALAFVCLAGLITFAVSQALLSRAVISPLERVTRHVKGLKDPTGLTRPLALGRADEIGELADALDAAWADLARLYAQLDRQNAMLRLLVENIPHPISVKDGHGRYLLANSALAELLLRRPQDVPGATDQELNAPALWARRSSRLEAEVLLGGVARFSTDEVFDAPGGLERFFETSRLPLADPESGAGRVLTVCLDITERIRTQERLRQSENRYRSLFDSMNEGVAVHEFVPAAAGTAPDYRILDVNPAFERILGIPRAEALGRLATELYGQQTAPFLDTYAEVAATGAPALFETYFAPMEKHFAVSAFSPSPGLFATIFTDTTERRKTLQALERAHLTIQHVLDSMPSPVIGVDAKARVTNVNKAAQRFSGGESATLLDRPLPEAFPQLASHLHAVTVSLEEALPAAQHKLTLESALGARLCDILVFPIAEGGEVTGAVVRIDDVTERVRMEEMVLQTEKMMSVGGLAAGMAHEINNPLGGILQSVQIVKRRIQEGLPANRLAAEEAGCPLPALAAYLEARQIPRFLDAIQEAGRRAATIVANMLEFSRRSESKMTPVRLDALLDKALNLASSDYDLKKKYDFRRIEIVRDYEPDIPDVRCTKTEIEQVLLNLIKNSAQAMAQKTDHPRIVLRLRREGDFARVEVEDNGPGMEEAVRKRAFEPFFTTKPPGLGTGLGLSVSFFIVTQNHGGTLTVDSAPGQGARFVIRLPLDRDSLD